MDRVEFYTELSVITLVTLFVFMIVTLILSKLGLVTNRFSAAVVWSCVSIPTFATWWKVRSKR